MATNIERINPEGLMQNPAFSQMVVTRGAGTTIYIGGQNAVNAKGEPVGKGDIALQTEQALQNLKIALEAVGATFANIVKLGIYIVQGQDLMKGFTAAQKFFDGSNPPAITGLFVSALATPDALVEIEAVAFLGDK